jgi:hypothetical protein
MLIYTSTEERQDVGVAHRLHERDLVQVGVGQKSDSAHECPSSESVKIW